MDKIIGNIIWNESEKYNFSIIRLKGVIYLKTKVYYIQGIYDIYEINEINVKEDYNFENKINSSKVLFIGRNLEKNKEIIYNKLNNI